MLRRHEEIHSGVLGRKVQVLAFGNYGAPVIAFPSGGGQYHDFEGNAAVLAHFTRLISHASFRTSSIMFWL